jgi:CheY-like chemotaxis protein
VFPEVEGLNPHFRPGAPKLRYLLDTSLDNALIGDVRSPTLDLFLPFFKRRSSHSRGCGRTRGKRGGEYLYEPSRSLEWLDDRVDIAHDLEHLVLDIQYDLGGAEIFGGVTCGLGVSTSQFVTVVESEETALGVFAVNAGLAMMHQALYSGTIDPRFHHVLDLVRWLRQSGRARLNAHEAAGELDIGLAQARYCLSALRVLEYPVELAETSDALASHVGPVLVVEDDDDGRAILGRFLAELGYDVRCVSSGRTAVDILARYETSVAVLNISLPDLDGVSIARWLIESQPATKLVLIAGGLDVLEHSGLVNSEIRVLPKPFATAAFHHTLRIVSAN